MKLQAVFWDFDGVILDSVHVKTKAFVRMFSKYGPKVEQAVLEYHLANGGISRFEKFRHYYNNLLNRPISDAELKLLGDEFSSLVMEEVLNAPFIPGVLTTLDDLWARGIPSFVVSGTPEEEVRHIVKERQLSRYFFEVCGSPRKKVEIITDILVRKGYDASKCVFLGDALTDYEAARESGVYFIGIINGETCSFPAGTHTLKSIELKEWTC